jgi:pseudoazurin
MKMALFAAAVGLTTLASTAALAADHEVQMLNRDSEGRVMQFEPAFLRVEPGDTITFVATDRGHNSEALEGGVPEGAELWKGSINEEVVVTLTEPGLYAYKCTPHFAMGMVGLIQVGDDTSNLEAVQSVNTPGRAGDRMAELLAEAEAGGAAGAAAPAEGDAAPVEGEAAPAEEPAPAQ